MDLESSSPSPRRSPSPEQSLPLSLPDQPGFSEIKAMKPIQSPTSSKLKHKTYKCPFEGCLAVFFASSALNAHIRAHTGERPFRCPYDGCGKAFTEQTNLSHHMKIHKDEKPFKCPQEGCGAHFRLKGGLTRHLRIHTGERPFPCTICKAKFSQKEHLASHVRAKHFALEEPFHNSESWNYPTDATSFPRKGDTRTEAAFQAPQHQQLANQRINKQEQNGNLPTLAQLRELQSGPPMLRDQADTSTQLTSFNNHQPTKYLKQFIRPRDY